MGGTCPGAGKGSEALPLVVANRGGDAFHGWCGRRYRVVCIKQCISVRPSQCWQQSHSSGQPAATGLVMCYSCLVTSLGFEEEDRMSSHNFMLWPCPIVLAWFACLLSPVGTLQA